ncbi:MAG: helix-turn-helix transcriptional regulator [Rhodospirillaceae bacterium]
MKSDTTVGHSPSASARSTGSPPSEDSPGHHSDRYSHACPLAAPPVLHAILGNALLDALGHAALACDSSGEILLANSEGEHILRGGDGLCRRDGMLVIHDRQAQKKARQIFLSPPPSDALDAVLVPRPSGLRSYQMVVKRPSTLRTASAVPPSVLIVTISDPASPPPMKHLAIAKLYSLTPAECRLAHDLVLGATPKEIAHRTGVKISTVRTQLRTLFQKTECNRQADLLRVFCTVPGLR